MIKIVRPGKSDLDLAPYATIESDMGMMDLDSEDSGRNALGQMIRDRITTKRKFNIICGPLTRAEAEEIIQAIHPVEFQIKTWDYLTGAETTIPAYAGDRTSAILNKDGMLSGLSFSITEG